MSWKKEESRRTALSSFSLQNQSVRSEAMLRWTPQVELPFTIGEPIREVSALTPTSIQWTSMITYAYEPLVAQCDTYLTEVEQGIISIENLSIDTIQTAYDRIFFEDEKEALRYRIEAMTYLQELNVKISSNVSWTWEEWIRVYQKVKNLVPSRLRNAYLKQLKAIEPSKSINDQQEVPSVDQRLGMLHGERYLNLPGPLRRWLREQVESNLASLEEISSNGLSRLDEEWKSIISAKSEEDWWERLNKIVLTDEIYRIGVREDWKALFIQPLPFTRWDQLLLAGKNQVSRRKKTERENQGPLTTIPVDMLTGVNKGWAHYPGTL